MCGIIGYIGEKEAAPILIEGLKALEYRGYDSAGIAVVGLDSCMNGFQTVVARKQGKISNLEQVLEKIRCKGNLGIGHTRWATHGEPSDINAHPHYYEDIALVHNGIIENHAALKSELVQEAYLFSSDTDSEVLPILIARAFHRGANNLEQAVVSALAHVEGAYAIAVVSFRYPDELVAACNSSPLVIGIGTDELFVASDELALAGKVSRIVHVKDREVVTLKRNGSYTFRGTSLA